MSAWGWPQWAAIALVGLIAYRLATRPRLFDEGAR